MEDFAYRLADVSISYNGAGIVTSASRRGQGVEQDPQWGRKAIAGWTIPSGLMSIRTSNRSSMRGRMHPEEQSGSFVIGWRNAAPKHATQYHPLVAGVQMRILRMNTKSSGHVPEHLAIHPAARVPDLTI
jgi:hypothetical protein